MHFQNNVVIGSTQIDTPWGPVTIPLAGPGPTAVMNWVDAKNALARFGSYVLLEVTGAVQIDSTTIRASMSPGGPYIEVIDANPILPGQARAIFIPPQTNGSLALPYVYLEVTNANGPTTIQLRVLNANF